MYAGLIKIITQNIYTYTIYGMIITPTSQVCGMVIDMYTFLK